MQMRWIDYLSFDLTSRSCKIAQNADEKNGTQKISWNRLGTYKFASSSLLHSLLNFIANHGVYLELWEHSTSEIDNNVCKSFEFSSRKLWQRSVGIGLRHFENVRAT